MRIAAVAVASALSISVHAAGPPVANASKSSNLSGKVPLLDVKLDASLSTCPNGCTKSDSYTWDFGDGFVALHGLTFSRDYIYERVYTATFTIKDDLGLTSSASVRITATLPPAESLTDYVQACQNQLNFQGIPNNLDCYDADLFDRAGDQVSDYVGYRRITDQVDMVFACRWLLGSKVADPQNAISVEMLVHNRQSGNTCFFSAKGFLSTGDPRDNKVTPHVIVSPTDAEAASFWDSPAAVNEHVRCIGCHVSGPYIATPKIAPFLAKYGLLNNSHDTLSNVSTGDLSTPNRNVKYHAVVTPGVISAFSDWDSLKQSYINPFDSGCSTGCHMVGTLSTQGTRTGPSFGNETVLANPSLQLQKINDANVMKPYDDGSDYRWINLDTAGDGVEKETFENANNANTTMVPKLFSSENPNCAQPNVPNVMEAHVVGSDNTFVVVQPGRFAFLADRLSVFNLEQGLVCLNSDQDPGQKCQDYRVRYECADEAGVKTWSNFSSRALSSDGDHEERPANVCAMGSKAIGIEAAYTHRTNDWTYSSIGPNDRLASFSQYGLSCNNAEQPDGECSNYVVRYSSCSAPPEKANRTLTNVFAVGKVLTAASNSLTKGQARNGSWNTQQWAIEPIKNTEYVRLRNTGNNVYLNVASGSESATVGTAASNGTTNQMWLIEPVSGSANIRLKNVYSGKYLTMADPKAFASTPNYLPVFSQTRNTSWTSQRWVIQ